MSEETRDAEAAAAETGSDGDEDAERGGESGSDARPPERDRASPRDTAGDADRPWPADSGADDRPEAERLIMEATFRALREHGYADLSIAGIAEEFEKSKSLLYYHYDSKEELIAAFLDFAADEFLAAVERGTASEDPVAAVRTFVDFVLAGEDEEVLDGQRAIIDLRAQAVSEPRFRERFTRVDRRLRDRLETALAAGVASGRLDSEAVDPAETAACLYATVTGAMTHRHTADGAGVASVRRSLHRRLDRAVRDDAE